jgi:hypothetical protein
LNLNYHLLLLLSICHLLKAKTRHSSLVLIIVQFLRIFNQELVTVNVLISFTILKIKCIRLSVLSNNKKMNFWKAHPGKSFLLNKKRKGVINKKTRLLKIWNMIYLSWSPLKIKWKGHLIKHFKKKINRSNFLNNTLKKTEEKYNPINCYLLKLKKLQLVSAVVNSYILESKVVILIHKLKHLLVLQVQVLLVYLVNRVIKKIYLWDQHLQILNIWRDLKMWNQH